MSSLQPIPDRLASLEAAVARLTADLDRARTRLAQQVLPLAAWPARTVEPDDGYPPPGSIELPIVAQALAVTGEPGEQTLTPSDRWSTGRVETALSRVGWLPPDLPVWVVHDRRRYVIVEAPAELHGVAVNQLAAAEWRAEYYSEQCDRYTLGRGLVQIWRQVGLEPELDGARPYYHAQTYADGSPVLMYWTNTSDAVAVDKFLTAHRNADNDWIVTVEPCDLSCTPGYA